MVREPGRRRKKEEGGEEEGEGDVQKKMERGHRVAGIQ
jgi:hypothetical protein